MIVRKLDRGHFNGFFYIAWPIFINALYASKLVQQKIGKDPQKTFIWPSPLAFPLRNLDGKIQKKV